MSQPIRMQTLTAAPTAGFAQPFEMLEACHDRVLRMLALLERLRGHVRTHGADGQARQAARDVMRYFDQAAPEHHRDEELHVFPILLKCADPATLEVVARLRQDHLLMESAWGRARDVLARIEGGELSMPAAQDEAALDAFALLYPDHIAAEESIAYPRAAAAMDAPAVTAMGGEMMRRRGVA